VLDLLKKNSIYLSVAISALGILAIGYHNKKFTTNSLPNITGASLNYIPSQIQNLVETYFYKKDKASVKNLDLSKTDVTNFDFSKFINLEVLDLSDTQGLTAELFNTMPVQLKASVKTLYLSKTNIKGFNFSKFTKLESVNAPPLTALQYSGGF
jgi:hypothetical protein